MGGRPRRAGSAARSADALSDQRLEPVSCALTVAVECARQGLCRRPLPGHQRKKLFGLCVGARLAAALKNMDQPLLPLRAEGGPVNIVAGCALQNFAQATERRQHGSRLAMGLYDARLGEYSQQTGQPRPVARCLEHPVPATAVRAKHLQLPVEIMMSRKYSYNKN